MKIVKIISIFVSIVAVAVIILPAVWGADTAKESQNVAANNNILQRFQKTRVAKQSASQDEVSPLVKEAKAFSLYLNPPPPPPPPPVGPGKANSDPGVFIEPPRPPVPGQFKLIATCVNESNPELSLALIDLPGEGTKWVRQSSKVNYLIIKEIKAGMVVASNGQQSINIMIEPKPFQPSLVKGQSTAAFTTSSTPVSPPSIPIINPASSAAATSRLGLTKTGPGTNPPAKTVQPVTQTRALTADEEAFVQKFMNDLDTITTDSTTEQDRIKKSDELLKKFFNDTNDLTMVTEQDTQPAEKAASKPDVKVDVNDPNYINRRIPRQRPVPPPK